MNLLILVCFIPTVLFFSCSDNGQSNQADGTTAAKTFYENKPPSTFSDTLKINSVAAVFYNPDSLQLKKIRSIADPGVFESKMHEYDYLIRTATSVIKTGFPQMKIIEVKNIRYLLFITSGKTESCIDLDKNYDPYGLYVFNRHKAPQLVDMANTETALGFYFSK